jgi:hypothetical protein
MLTLQTCQACGASLQSWQRLCHSCGQPLATSSGSPPAPLPGAPYCPQCGVALAPGPCYCAWCGAHFNPASAYRVPDQRPYIAAYPPPYGTVGVLVPQKSLTVAFLLTFFFGPFGLLYSTMLGGLLMIPVTLVVSLLTFGLGDFLLWPVCIIWGMMAAAGYNDRLTRGVTR